MEQPAGSPDIVLSFDVEPHDCIEAAAGLDCPSALRREYAERLDYTTRGLLDVLSAAGAQATFFVLGNVARANPRLVRDIAAQGHEVASHGWDHRRVHRFTPAEFLEDLRASKDELEQASGQPVYGYRAPTFSVGRRTGWAIDMLAEAGHLYDSSVFPVRHDRYGVPDAPRTPFVAEGESAQLIELPPATWRVLGQNLPVAGGGYFRLFPPAAMGAGLRQLGRADPAVGVLYFHPWEFDPGQPRLPLRRLARWRTYVGIGRSGDRLGRLLARHAGRFRRAIDVVADLEMRKESLPRFRLQTAGIPALVGG
jgi:polysaccharide deacetylase family protein (PEP-CTERM system associated)